MHSIEKVSYGYRIVFGGFIKADEMLEWVRESDTHLAHQAGAFGVLVDMRELKPLPSDAQVHLQNGQKLYKAKGMQRSAVILQNPVITMQFKRMAQETGIYQWERYLDASKTADWEKKAVAWLTSGTDPDK
jgi:hypothetical protein